MAGASEVARQAGLAAFNALPAADAERSVLGCCASARWTELILAGRPYRTTGELLDRSDAATDELTQADLQDGLGGHPRLGGARERAAEPNGAGASRAEGPGTSAGAGWSAREQAGISASGEADRRALALGNEVYEQRFGHIYLACATGRDASELLELLRSRLGNDPETEWEVVRSELAQINRIRLTRLIEDGA